MSDYCNRQTSGVKLLITLHGHITQFLHTLISGMVHICLLPVLLSVRGIVLGRPTDSLYHAIYRMYAGTYTVTSQLLYGVLFLW